MNANSLLANGSTAEIKYRDPDESQDSRQLDIVISKERLISRNADSVVKIQELEKETEKLDLIKQKFEETLQKSVRLAQFNYQNENSELGVLDSQLNSILNSKQPSMVASPKKKEN